MTQVRKPTVWPIVLMLVFAIPLFAAAQPEPAADKTLSPYFRVQSDDPETDRLPLKSTAAEVEIAGVIADIRVTQTYKNEGSRPLEAIYVFPASTRAAVYGMRMTIGERTIVAEIKEREQARQDYEAAREAGKSASLLEQQRPNVFQMNVANILPGDVIEVELKYTELLVPEDGVYELVYPTVVGPRYSETPKEGAPDSEQWVENPYLREGEAPPYTFDIQATISAGMPIADVSCPSHPAEIDFRDRSVAKVRLDPSASGGGDRDFILRYRLQGGKIQTGLLLHEGESERFFLLMVQPPDRVAPETIPPREYVFIVDVSGSMRGFPLEVSKTLLKDLIGNLRPTDRFNVLLFAGGSRLLAKTSLPATAENVSRALSHIDNQHGGGGTRILPALHQALSLPGTENYARTFVVVTDGYVNVERETFDLIRDHLNEASVFTFGIGRSVNRFLIEGMARAGMGAPFVVTETSEAAGQATTFREYIRTPLLTHVDLDWEGFKAYDVEPPTVPDVFAERPVIVFGKWRGEPAGTIRLSGQTGGGPYTAEIEVDRESSATSHEALAYLWARHRIALLSDYNGVRQDPETTAEVTRLGLEYNLLTQYTSFVAIDSRVRREGDEVTTVKQPLPLPAGVPGTAVGAAPGAYQTTALRRSLSAAPAMPTKMAAEMQPPVPEPKADRSKVTAEVTVALKPDRTRTSENLDADALNQFFNDTLQKSLKRCGRAAKVRHPGLSGEIELTITLDGTGRVTGVTVDKETLQNKFLIRCLTRFVERTRFPVPRDGKAGTVTFLIDLSVK